MNEDKLKVLVDFRMSQAFECLDDNYYRNDSLLGYSMYSVNRGMIY